MDCNSPQTGSVERDLKELLSGACEQNGSMLVITDREGRITYANRGFTRLTGYSLEEAIGSNPRMLQSGQTSPATYHQLWNTINRGEVWHGEVLNRKKSGDLYWASLTIAPIKDSKGAITHFVGMEEDITSTKHLEEELRSANKRLEIANDELQKFTSIVSHDLRAPIATIATAIKLLCLKDADKLSPDGEKMLEAMEKSIVAMDRLVTDLLAYARVGARALRVEAIDSGSLADSAIENLAAFIAERGAVIRRNDLPPVYADQTFLMEVFQNLIENATKYNRNEVPTVEISAVSNDSETVFTVRDNGIGFPTANAEKIFTAFTRLSSSFSGTGLGLASCKRAVEAHGGRIWAESVPGEGSAFHFSLPKAPPG